jgi:hypothetical protein
MRRLLLSLAVALAASAAAAQPFALYNTMLNSEADLEDLIGTGVVTTGEQAAAAGAVLAAARKGASGTIAKGQPVHITGYNNGQDVVEVETADADDGAAMPALGLAYTALTNSATGSVITSGRLDGVDTSPWPVGTRLWVSTDPSTTLGLTATRPVGADAEIQRVAIVVRSHASQGVLEVFGPGKVEGVPNLDAGELFVGSASNAAARVALSGDGSLSSSGALTVDDDSHAHTGATVPVFASTAINATTWGDGSLSSFAWIYDQSGTVVGDPTLTFEDGRITLGPAAAHFSLPLQSDAATPTLAFGDLDSGFYESSDDVIRLGLGGAGVFWQWNSTDFSANLSGGPSIVRIVPTATVASLRPRDTDTDTGIGSAAGDQLSLIAGGVEILRLFEGTVDYADFLVPARFPITDSPPACDATIEGAIYYDDSLNEHCGCNGATPSWNQLDGGGGC